MRYALDPGSSRPRLGPFGGPLFGVRAVAEAAGLDGSEVLALLRADQSDVVVAMVSARHFEQLESARAAKAERVDWAALNESGAEIRLN